MKPGSTASVLIAALLLAGCAGAKTTMNAGGPYTTPGVIPATGTAYSTSFIHVEGNPNGYFGLLLIGLIGMGLHDEYLNEAHGADAYRVPPQMDAGRAIVERDCTQPMEAISANLRCKK